MENSRRRVKPVRRRAQVSARIVEGPLSSRRCTVAGSEDRRVHGFAPRLPSPSASLGSSASSCSSLERWTQGRLVAHQLQGVARSSSSDDSASSSSSSPGPRRQQQPRATAAKRRSRASRTERYLRRVAPPTNPLVEQTLRLFSEWERADETSRLLVDGISVKGATEVHNESAVSPRPNGQTRRSGDLEQALRELEAIYDSLQLGDEQLLDRAEQRCEEELLYSGLAAATRTQSPAEVTPDRLTDDMAYRRLHPRPRPEPSAALAAVSYLTAGPTPCARSPEATRRGEPDAALDDVVFRSMRHANSTLKVVEPQPPFGIPLGPVSAAPATDYLHAQPIVDAHLSRSGEPDVVSDDLAFRSLRQRAPPPPSTPSPLPLPPPPPATPREEQADYQQLCRDLEDLLQLTRGLSEQQPAAEVPLEIPQEATPPLATEERACVIRPRVVAQTEMALDRRSSLTADEAAHWQGVNRCNHKYNSMPAKTSTLHMFRQYGSKRNKSKNRKSMCSIS